MPTWLLSNYQSIRIDGQKNKNEMALKTKKMTLKYWNSLSDSSKKRALQYTFPIHPAIVEMLMNEKPDLKSEGWKMVFKKVRIPAPGSYYKTVVNNTYLN
jgi:hypothetical protein